MSSLILSINGKKNSREIIFIVIKRGHETNSDWGLWEKSSQERGCSPQVDRTWWGKSGDLHSQEMSEVSITLKDASRACPQLLPPAPFLRLCLHGK